MERCRDRGGVNIKGDNKEICMEPKENVLQHQSRHLITTPRILGCDNFFFLKTFNSVDIVLKMHLAYETRHKN